MHKFATYFSVIFLLLSLAMLFSVVYFNLPLILNGNRIALFVFLNCIMLVGVGIFFNIFKERIILYWQNYRREKQI
jgi:hypothetical protein